MRNLIRIALWVALGVQAADVSSQAIDLDPRGALEALQQDKPEHYARVLEMMEEIQTVPYAPSGQMDLRREVQAPDATQGRNQRGQGHLSSRLKRHLSIQHNFLTLALIK